MGYQYQPTAITSPVLTEVDYDQIEQQRKRLGFTYSEISRRSKINLNRVINLMRGDSDWNIHLLHNILNILRLQPSDVIADKELLQHYLSEVEYLKSNANGIQTAKENHNENAI